MWGDGAWGEVAWGGAQDESGTGIQDRTVTAVITITAEGAGNYNQDGAGSARFLELDASGISGRTLTRVRVIQTTPKSGRGKTGLSHTGLN